MFSKINLLKYAELLKTIYNIGSVRLLQNLKPYNRQDIEFYIKNLKELEMKYLPIHFMQSI